MAAVVLSRLCSLFQKLQLMGLVVVAPQTPGDSSAVVAPRLAALQPGELSDLGVNLVSCNCGFFSTERSGMSLYLNPVYFCLISLKSVIL